MLLVAGCNEGASLDLRVDLKTDYVGGAEVRVARMTLFDDAGAVIGDTDTQLDSEDLTEGIRIGEFSELARGQYRVVVDLEGQLSVPTRTVLLNITDSFGVTVVVARGCAEVTCPAGDPSLTECVGGECVSPECTPENPEACPAPECVTDSECSTIADCATAACVGGYCTARADSSTCYVGGYCNPDTGCAPQPCNENNDCGACARCGGTECEPYGIQSIHAGHQSSCLLDDEGQRWCWGNDPNNELGVGADGGYRSVPYHASDAVWDDIVVGWTRSAGIQPDGSRWSWGGSRTTPEQVDTGGWQSASLVHQTLLYLRDDGTLWRNSEQVGTDNDWFFARAGWDHFCAIKDSGELFCWGENEFGQLGFASEGDVDIPTLVNDDVDWVSVSGGEENSCAVKSDGTLWCWGSDYGEVPTQLGTRDDWVDFIYKWKFGCGITGAGEILCMGANPDGELGRETDGASLMPEPISLAGPWHGLTVGGHFACAYNDRVDVEGWHCWGAGFGMGTGVDADSVNPTPTLLCPP